MKVRKILVSRLQDLKRDDIKSEHEPSCRTLKGLKKELKKFYPTLAKDSVVTVVYFEVKT